MLPQKSPVLVTQNAVTPLARWALLILCSAYIFAGYIGREPWKNADIAAFGTMLEISRTNIIDSSTNLTYLIGAAAIKVGEQIGINPEFAVRIPFMLMLAGVLFFTWIAVYSLARNPSALPIAFAFGGQAQPKDYARAMADASALALIATLGLAQFSHETTVDLASLFFQTMLFAGFSALPFYPRASHTAIIISMPAFALTGSPSLSIIYGIILLIVISFKNLAYKTKALITIAAAITISAALSISFNLYKISPFQIRTDYEYWRALIRLLIWFSWPVWPLVLWTLWRWRAYLLNISEHRHLGLPALFALIPLFLTIFTSGDTAPANDRTLLLSLPALAALAAFALPTFKRSASSLIDWFSVLFFSAWAIVIWIVWLAMQTGFPAKPAANVAKLAQGFTAPFQWAAFLIAAIATLTWFAIVRWRVQKNQPAIWKSLVLPAAGAVLCWLLLMTLWLPALDYARSFKAQMNQISEIIGHENEGTSCIQTHGLDAAQIAGAKHYGGWQIVPSSAFANCPWMLVDIDSISSSPANISNSAWLEITRIIRPTAKDETLIIYKNIATH